MPIRRDIQGLRAVAIALVVAYHAGGILPSGFIGVDVFFVISGFVVAASIGHEVAEGRFNLVSFIGRRIRRLLPALSLLLVTVVVLSTWFSLPAARLPTVRTGVAASFAAANAYLYRFRPEGYFEDAEKHNALLHTWSLSVEEQFFLCLGLAAVVLAWIAARSRRAARRCARVAIVSALFGSFALCMLSSASALPNAPWLLERALGPTKLGPEFGFYMPITRAWQFLAGVLLAVILPRIGAGRSRLLPLLGMGMIVASGIALSVENYPHILSVVPTVGTVLVIGGSAGSGALGRVLGSGIAQWVGDRSYGIYLWHWPMLVFLRPFAGGSPLMDLVAVAVAVVVAALSHRFVESPIRFGERWTTRGRVSGVLLVSVAMPLVAVGTTRDLSPELGPHLDRVLGCEYGALESLSHEGRCTLRVDGAVGRAVLIGDSHAGMLSTGFVIAARDNDLDAVLAIETGTPFLIPASGNGDGAGSGTRAVVDALVESRPSVVVVAQSAYSGEWSSWLGGFSPVVESLNAAGIPVVIAQTSFFPYVEPLECSSAQVFLGMCPADRVIDARASRWESRERQSQEASLAKSSSLVVLLDTSAVTCPGETCEARRGGVWWWRDRTHVSLHASKALAPSLSVALREAIARAAQPQ